MPLIALSAGCVPVYVSGQGYGKTQLPPTIHGVKFMTWVQEKSREGGHPAILVAKSSTESYAALTIHRAVAKFVDGSEHGLIAEEVGPLDFQIGPHNDLDWVAGYRFPNEISPSFGQRRRFTLEFDVTLHGTEDNMKFPVTIEYRRAVERRLDFIPVGGAATLSGKPLYPYFDTPESSYWLTDGWR